MLVVKSIRNILIGFGIANIFLLIFILFAGAAGQTEIDIDILRTQVIGSICFGAFCGILSLIFESQRLSIVIKTGIQLFALLIGFAAFGYYLGWFRSLEEMMFMLIIFMIIYVIIWLFMYIIQKNWLTN